MNGSSEKTVLLIDDNVEVLELMDVNCQIININVDHSTNGQDAIEKIAKKSYQAYVVDLGLPDIAGTDLIRHIYNADKNCRIIIQSGSPVNISDLRRFGVISYMAKPFSSEEFRKNIKKAVEFDDDRS